MDEAAVFTIHGFCQRMLSLNAFESGMLFEQQLIEDESRLRYQACADFWRRHCYPLPRDIAAVIHDVVERAARSAVPRPLAAGRSAAAQIAAGGRDAGRTPSANHRAH
jgi:ATP-dependent exoDNAse (exonuclease V) beta subunit